jgi:hypothetical protein
MLDKPKVSPSPKKLSAKSLKMMKINEKFKPVINGIKNNTIENADFSLAGNQLY